jgi:hypothetical protein
VFIGIVGGTGALWTFVTDSTGSKILWEKSQLIPYKSKSFTPTGISVCATSDSGFTVVGKINFPDELGGINGFIAHYVPKSITAVNTVKNSCNKTINYMDVYLSVV